MGDKELRELQAIKKILMLMLVKQGASSQEIDLAVKMGAGNIRATFPANKIKKLTR